MSRLVLVMRHGKSSWAEIVLADHDRPLAKRGKRDAVRVGEALLVRGLVPDLIVSSTARRARATAKRVARACEYGGEIVCEPLLYLEGVSGCLRALASCPDDAQVVMLIGHNPALEDLVEFLTSEAMALPTAAVAGVELPIESWAEISPQVQATLRFVLRARELSDTGRAPPPF